MGLLFNPNEQLSAHLNLVLIFDVEESFNVDKEVK